MQVPIHLEGKTTTNEEEAEEDPQGSRQVKCKYKLDTLKTLCQEKLSNILDEKNCLMIGHTAVTHGETVLLWRAGKPLPSWGRANDLQQHSCQHNQIIKT